MMERNLMFFTDHENNVTISIEYSLKAQIQKQSTKIHVKH